jgi:hypothetical protein
MIKSILAYDTDNDLLIVFGMRYARNEWAALEKVKALDGNYKILATSPECKSKAFYRIQDDLPDIYKDKKIFLAKRNI